MTAGFQKHDVLVKLPIRIIQICGGPGAISNNKGTANGSDPERAGAKSATNAEQPKEKRFLVQNSRKGARQFPQEVVNQKCSRQLFRLATLLLQRNWLVRRKRP